MGQRGRAPATAALYVVSAVGGLGACGDGDAGIVIGAPDGSTRVDGGGPARDVADGGGAPVTETCADGDRRSCASAACGAGEQECVGGAWSACRAIVGVAEEACGDWFDDDCDGSVDEGCSCADDDALACSNDCTQAAQLCEAGAWGTCMPGVDESRITALVLRGTVRDFADGVHPDFGPATCGEYGDRFMDAPETGMLEDVLDGEGKPVLRERAHCTISDPASYAQWYRDVPGTNASRPIAILLERDGPGFVYASDEFFPIDGELLDTGGGDDCDAVFEACDDLPRACDDARERCLRDDRGRDHNYLFTTELRGRFTYRGGERFSFRGDDDLWVFVDRHLALDLGGLHTSVEGTIDFDELASSRGLVVGRSYEIAIFHAERAPSESNFQIGTTLARIDSCLF